MIGVLDYGVGNINAFLRIFHSQNISAMPIVSAGDFELVDKVILPGVGAFDVAMTKLNNSGLRDGLDNAVLNTNMPLLGVCIGMHMLGKYSEEGSLEGLNYIGGCTKKIPTHTLNERILLPHMGWNDVSNIGDNNIWVGINLSEGFYFLHSYMFVPDCQHSVIGTSEYAGIFASAVNVSNIYGFQFHPEKSLFNGIQLLTNFAGRN
ncbi:imidazole glycerol phosphate synthase subunit HisH [Pseudomonadales bacterium]|nr:imidazole glycerol phosphate synthase subunit HisH [Pseudomonadales bacterium]